MEVAQWHQVMQKTYEMVNTFPDTPRMAKDLRRARPQYEIRGQTDYTFGLEFTDKGIIYHKGGVPNPNCRFVYPSVEVFSGTLTGAVPPLGTGAVLAGIDLYGNPTFGQMVVAALVANVMGAFQQTMSEINA